MSPRILAIDRQPERRQRVESALRRCGHEVVGLGELPSAAALAGQGELDAVVLALVPGAEGLDALRSLRLRAETAGLPVLALAAQAAGRAGALREGAGDCLGVPFEEEELVLRVERLLGAAAAAPSQLAGDLSEFPLVEVIQQLEHGRKSGILCLEGAVVGRVELSQGRIREASCGGLSRSDALLTLLPLRRGRFRFAASWRDGRDATAEAAESEEMSLQQLLLEAAWLEDELARRRRFLPPASAALARARRERPAAPADLPRCPLKPILAWVELFPGISLDGLLRRQVAAPDRVRLAVAWLVEQGILALSQPAVAAG